MGRATVEVDSTLDSVCVVFPANNKCNSLFATYCERLCVECCHQATLVQTKESPCHITTSLHRSAIVRNTLPAGVCYDSGGRRAAAAPANARAAGSAAGPARARCCAGRWPAAGSRALRAPTRSGPAATAPPPASSPPVTCRQQPAFLLA